MKTVSETIPTLSDEMKSTKNIRSKNKLDGGGVAQLVEQRTFNPLVLGSSPSAFILLF